MAYSLAAAPRGGRRVVRVDSYRFYQTHGWLRMAGLLPAADVARLKRYADDLWCGRIDVPGVEPPPIGATEAQLAQRFTRIHMLHRQHAEAEWGLLHPRVLDVLEALVGPDILALQSMLFFNPPGRGGQGWHQDAYYITTFPDTLIGAWMALERADEANGCLWVADGSHIEPIYPPADRSTRFVHARDAFHDLPEARNVSHLEDEVNSLAPVAQTYRPWRPVPMDPGDVLFFHSHLLHRSYPNQTPDRSRRAYVCHYCSARSWVPWNHGAPFEGDCANDQHILARGATHLPYARPAFGTPVDLPDPLQSLGMPARMMAAASGDMEPAR